MNRLHYLLCYRNAVRENFLGLAHAIAVLYFAEFGEAIPSSFRPLVPNPAQHIRQARKDGHNPFTK